MVSVSSVSTKVFFLFQFGQKNPEPTLICSKTTPKKCDNLYFSVKECADLYSKVLYLFLRRKRKMSDSPT